VSACVECREELLSRRTLIERLSSDTNRGQPIGACDADLRPGFQDSRCRDANIVILPEGGVNQVLKLLVLKQLPPFLVTERFRSRLWCLLRRSSTVRARNIYAWSLIVGPDGAAGKKKYDQGKCDKSLHSVSPRWARLWNRRTERVIAAFRQTLNQNEQRRNDEYGNTSSSYHATNYGRAHDLTGH
jgi:hypothetical protein